MMKSRQDLQHSEDVGEGLATSAASVLLLLTLY